jgi:hypothetical protein
MAKKRGGQLKNTNAFKHGFYSKHYSESENQALSEIPLTDVTDMIVNFGVTTARFMEAYYTSLDEQDYKPAGGPACHQPRRRMHRRLGAPSRVCREKSQGRIRAHDISGRIGGMVESAQQNRE